MRVSYRCVDLGGLEGASCRFQQSLDAGLFVLDEGLQLGDEIPRHAQHRPGVVPLCHLVEELDDVGEVHVVVEDDVAVVLDQRQCDEEHKVR